MQCYCIVAVQLIAYEKGRIIKQAITKTFIIQNLELLMT